MKSAVFNELPHLSSTEIALRCQAIRRKWSGNEMAQRRRDGQRQMKALDHQLRYRMVAGTDRYDAKGPLDLVRLIAG
ncbi:hypothetical protein [Blastopirellula retiformator]|uniref:Uncharacterized protein n=1 Tax=Blastopirellula retiformator TaxID=2527970 RepID=A0A5C5USE1_9BACT|nr:hypothetical protein [Blastopirellula retiformator]TWT29294.1 hypothetical protein Enr8_50950 [Blastopirellula retiformator]